MHTLRKCVLQILIIFLTTALHAKSDLCLDVGLRVAEVSWKNSGAYVAQASNEPSDTLYGMYAGLTNYNVWGIGKRGIIAAGFMDGAAVSVSEHDATSATFVLGPAFAATMGRVLTFQCAPAFSIGALFVKPNPERSDTSMTIGFALDGRVCFMPEARAAPLAGVRYEYSKIKSIFDCKIDRGAFLFYAGVAMQLSKW